MWTLVHMTFLSFSFLLQFSWIYSCRFRSIDNVFVDCINQIWTFYRATEFIWFLSHVKSILEFICRGLDFTLIFDKIEKKLNLLEKKNQTIKSTDGSTDWASECSVCIGLHIHYVLYITIFVSLIIFNNLNEIQDVYLNFISYGIDFGPSRSVVYNQNYFGALKISMRVNRISIWMQSDTDGHCDVLPFIRRRTDWCHHSFFLHASFFDEIFSFVSVLTRFHCENRRFHSTIKKNVSSSTSKPYRKRDWKKKNTNHLAS